MLFARNRTRLGRATKIERKTVRACGTVRQQYTEKMNSLVCKRRGEKLKKRVFFGDGDFSSSHRGHISIPNKEVLKSLATRGLTFLLDKYNTSLQRLCPCGKAELEDVCLHDNMPAGSGTRLRCHKNTSGPERKCCIQSILGKESMDRDVFSYQAVINVSLCATSTILGFGRPEHLCRP